MSCTMMDIHKAVLKTEGQLCGGSKNLFCRRFLNGMVMSGPQLEGGGRLRDLLKNVNDRKYKTPLDFVEWCKRYKNRSEYDCRNFEADAMTQQDWGNPEGERAGITSKEYLQYVSDFLDEKHKARLRPRPPPPPQRPRPPPPPGTKSVTNPQKVKNISGWKLNKDLEDYKAENNLK